MGDAIVMGEEESMLRNRSNESGMTLVETMIALLVMLFGLMALAQVLAFSLLANKTYGRDATKTTAYARDKMEELIILSFGDTTTNVAVNPPFPASGVGLSAGGNLPPNAPVAGYVDYLDGSGVRTTASGAFYTRQWQVVDDAATLKRIMVGVTSNKSFKNGTPPSSTTVTYKTP